jgi:hypothetical protein
VRLTRRTAPPTTAATASHRPRTVLATPPARPLNSRKTGLGPCRTARGGGRLEEEPDRDLDRGFDRERDADVARPFDEPDARDRALPPRDDEVDVRVAML